MGVDAPDDAGDHRCSHFGEPDGGVLESALLKIPADPLKGLGQLLRLIQVAEPV